MVEVKDDEGSSGLTTEKKGKTKVVNVITLETSQVKEPEVMPVGKQTTEEREANRGVAGPSKKKSKVHEGDDAKN